MKLSAHCFNSTGSENVHHSINPSSFSEYTSPLNLHHVTLIPIFSSPNVSCTSSSYNAFTQLNVHPLIVTFTALFVVCCDTAIATHVAVAPFPFPPILNSSAVATNVHPLIVPVHDLISIADLYHSILPPFTVNVHSCGLYIAVSVSDLISPPLIVTFVPCLFPFHDTT